MFGSAFTDYLMSENQCQIFYGTFLSLKLLIRVSLHNYHAMVRAWKSESLFRLKGQEWRALALNASTSSPTRDIVSNALLQRMQLFCLGRGVCCVQINWRRFELSHNYVWSQEWHSLHHFKSSQIANLCFASLLHRFLMFIFLIALYKISELIIGINIHIARQRKHRENQAILSVETGCSYRLWEKWF